MVITSISGSCALYFGFALRIDVRRFADGDHLLDGFRRRPSECRIADGGMALEAKLRKHRKRLDAFAIPRPQHLALGILRRHDRKLSSAIAECRACALILNAASGGKANLIDSAGDERRLCRAATGERGRKEWRSDPKYFRKICHARAPLLTRQSAQ